MKTSWLVAGAALLAVLCSATSARAADPVSFSCTASAVIGKYADAPALNPITAGGEGKACQPAITGLPNVGEATTLEEIVTAQTAYAAVDPGGAPPINSMPTARAGIEMLDLAPASGPALEANAANSSIQGSCVNGAPQFETQSEVGSLSLGGFPLVIDGVLQPITEAMNESIGALITIELNEVVDTDDGGRAVRAAHITLLPLDGSMAPVMDIIIAESKLGLNGAACDPSQPPNNGDDGDVDPDPPTGVCPEGSVFDPSRNVCVIPAPGSQTNNNPAGDITGPGSVIVGPTFTGPSGGTVITLQDARRRFPRSKCVSGGGPRFAIVGTPGRDRLTGTNRRDRMLGLGGKDRLDGGRKADCLEGGRGNDRLSGGQGRDRMFGSKGRDGLNGGQQSDRIKGGAGRDFLNGGPRNDRLFGGKGNDYLNAAFGRDRLKGGRGRDKMNVATAGVPARVSGGRGFDKVRANPGDVRFIRRDVERVIITKRIR